METHNCELNLSFLKLKSSDKSLKYQCNICKTLYRKVVNQFNHVNHEYIPYKCAGYMIKDNMKCKCDAPTNRFYRNYAYCAEHAPHRYIVNNKNAVDQKKVIESQRNLIKSLDNVENLCYSLRIESTERDDFTGDFEACKDNVTGYMEL
jgi:hypothetical protein